MSAAPFSDFLRQAQERGYIHQVTDIEALDARLRAGPTSAYVGFDCTADSLHVGHLLSIMLLRLYQRTGHRPVALIGGGTTKVGDPSGKDEARQLLSDAQIEANKAGIRRGFDAFLDFGEGRAVMLDNAEWLDQLRYIPFLRDIGRHFSVNRMLSMDSVKLRLERDQPLSFLEFNYMLLQSYDFLELHRRHGVALQMGGSDQWGNIVMGADLVRRVEGEAAFGLTTPLLTTAGGAKMGKTAAGAVWLNPDRLSPWDYWQFWRNADDADVGRFLALFTDLPMDEVRRLGALRGGEVNEAKHRLATEATALLHGSEAAEQAAETAGRLFGRVDAGAGGSISTATASLGPGGASALPEISLSLDELRHGVPAVALLVRSGLAASNSEAKKLIRNRGARLNDEVIPDENTMVTESDLHGKPARISAGRKRHVLVRAAG